MKIRMTINEKSMTATLTDNPTARDFGYSEGLFKLGRFDAGVEALNARGPLEVTIEILEK